MRIDLINAGKRFNREWIFKNASLQFQSGNAYAITGANGSGKSTMLQCIAGMLQLSSGGVEYITGGYEPGNGGKKLSPDEAYKHISFCAPYMEAIEEMTLVEFLQFHKKFKDFLPGADAPFIIELLDLQAAAHKQIRNFSSGMKQRVKLAQAILSNTETVLLDEPCSNFDAKGIALYHSLIDEYCKNRLVIVCSNDEVEYSFCNERIDVQEYKNS